MQMKDEIAEKTSEFLLQIKAVKLNVKEPFTWSSGLISPIYCDNRVILSFPVIRTYVRQAFVNYINEEFGNVDLIVGVATGAIAHAALVAQELGLPFAYVRSSKKEHGLTNMIEGQVLPGQSAVVIEDLVSTGKSSLNALKAVRDAGCTVKGMLAIFTYCLKKAEENFMKENCSLFTLTNYDKLIIKALQENYIREEDLKELRIWKENPEAWAKSKQ